MLLVYCFEKTARLDYVFKLVLEELAGIDFRITTNVDEYKATDLPCLNYSGSGLKEAEVFIKANALLFEKGVKEQQLKFTQEENAPQLHFNNGDNFDPFSAAFFLVSRYEEYLPYTPDEFHRFPAVASEITKQNLLHLPLVNLWSEEVKQVLKERFPSLSSTQRPFSAVITIDVDQAYAFKYRGMKRQAISLIRNVALVKPQYLLAQAKTLSNLCRDPFDSFEYLRQCQSSTELQFIYFINVGKYSKYDKNTSTSNTQFRRLLKGISSYAEIGLHPSFYTNEFPEKFFEEKSDLEWAIGKQIRKSRQHFLKLKLPHTYRCVIDAGLTDDYTMGYASHPGFRAGICTPFKWFDLEKDLSTELLVHPITYMEGSFHKLHCSPSDAASCSDRFIDIVKRFNGEFVSLWHNHTVNESFAWKGWRTVFEQSLRQLNNICV